MEPQSVWGHREYTGSHQTVKGEFKGVAPFFEVSRGCFAQFDGAFDSGCVWLPHVSSPSVFIPRQRIAASRAAPVRLGSPDLLPVPATDVRSTQQFLLRHRPEDIHEPHVLALVCNALRAIDPSARDATPYLDRLDALKRSSADGKQIWWEQSLGGRTTLYGSGRSGSIETTALATLAFLQSGKHLASARAGLAWIVRAVCGGWCASIMNKSA
jgi:hypothetical protein